MVLSNLTCGLYFCRLTALVHVYESLENHGHFPYHFIHPGGIHYYNWKLKGIGTPGPQERSEKDETWAITPCSHCGPWKTHWSDWCRTEREYFFCCSSCRGSVGFTANRIPNCFIIFLVFVLKWVIFTLSACTKSERRLSSVECSWRKLRLDKLEPDDKPKSPIMCTMMNWTVMQVPTPNFIILSWPAIFGL